MVDDHSPTVSREAQIIVNMLTELGVKHSTHGWLIHRSIHRRVLAVFANGIEMSIQTEPLVTGGAFCETMIVRPTMDHASVQRHSSVAELREFLDAFVKKSNTV